VTNDNMTLFFDLIDFQTMLNVFLLFFYESVAQYQITNQSLISHGVKDFKLRDQNLGFRKGRIKTLNWI